MRLSDEEIAGLKEMFKMIDTDGSGQISFEELKEGLRRFGADLDESEIHDLMKAVSTVLFMLHNIHSFYILHSTKKVVRVVISVINNKIYTVSQADVDNSGSIDYEEFIAATLHQNKIQREDHLFAAFAYFDKDSSGYITADEIQQACQEFGIQDVQLEDLIQEVDQDNVSTLILYNCFSTKLLIPI